MQLELYDRFLDATSRGHKTAAAAAVSAFVASFESDAEREQWTRSFLATHGYGKPIRHELYAGIIFPVLIEGAARGEAWSLYWLAATAVALARDQRLSALAGHRGELAFLKQAYAADPNSNDIRLALLDAMIGHLRHATHTWPAGILWGMDGATAAQCSEILDEIARAAALDREQRFTVVLADAETNVRAYQARLGGADTT